MLSWVSPFKCMSNYLELSTHREYGNIFPMSCRYSFRVTRARSQDFETITGNKFAARDKCRLIDAQKLQRPIIDRYFEMLLGVGTHLLIGTPGCTLEVSNVSYFCFACVMPFFVNNRYLLKISFYFSSAMFINADLLSHPGSFLYFITIAFPINWLPEHRFSRCREAPIQEREARL